MPEGTLSSRKDRLSAGHSGPGRSVRIQAVEHRTDPLAESGGAGRPVQVLQAPLARPVRRDRLDVATQIRQLDELHGILRRLEVLEDELAPDRTWLRLVVAELADEPKHPLPEPSGDLLRGGRRVLEDIVEDGRDEYVGVFDLSGPGEQARDLDQVIDVRCTARALAALLAVALGGELERMKEAGGLHRIFFASNDTTVRCRPPADAPQPTTSAARGWGPCWAPSRPPPGGLAGTCSSCPRTRPG